jgi:hypothetical protein
VEKQQVALGNLHAVRMRHIVNGGLSGSTKFFYHSRTNGAIFEKKRLVNIKCVFIFSTTFVPNIFNSKKN